MTAEIPAFAQVFREQAPRVLRCLLRLGVRQADVDDVLQEVFLIVHQKLPSYDARAPLGAFIYGIALRKASDYRRRAHIVREKSVDAVPEEGGTDQESVLAGREGLARLDEALQELADDKREAFVLYEIEGLSLSEIAEATRTPLKTVHSRIASARLELGERLRQKGSLS